MNSPKQNKIERKAKIFALCSDPNRLKILQFLMKASPATVSELATHIEMSVACTSHHLQLLKDNQIVISQRQGNNIYYQITDDPFLKKLETLILN